MMKSKGKIETHTAFLKSQDVTEICSPLFNAFDLNYFAYCQIHKNAELTVLISDPLWLKQFIHKNYYYQNKRKLSPGFHAWEDTQQTATVNDFRENFNHHRGFYLINQAKDYIETGIFAAPRSNIHAIDKCVNHLDAIQKFMIYFKQSASDLLKESDKSRLILNEMPTNKLQNEPSESDEFNEHQFQKDIQLKRYTLQCDQQHIHITAQEWACLSELCLGKSAKEIAKQLHLSHRSVETYLAHIRLKLGCHSKQDLIKIAKENGC